MGPHQAAATSSFRGSQPRSQAAPTAPAPTSVTGVAATATAARASHPTRRAATLRMARAAR